MSVLPVQWEHVLRADPPCFAILWNTSNELGTRSWVINPRSASRTPHFGTVSQRLVNFWTLKYLLQNGGYAKRDVSLLDKLCASEDEGSVRLPKHFGWGTNAKKRHLSLIYRGRKGQFQICWFFAINTATSLLRSRANKERRFSHFHSLTITSSSVANQRLYSDFPVS